MRGKGVAGYNGEILIKDKSSRLFTKIAYIKNINLEMNCDFDEITLGAKGFKKYRPNRKGWSASFESVYFYDEAGKNKFIEISLPGNAEIYLKYAPIKKYNLSGNKRTTFFGKGMIRAYSEAVITGMATMAKFSITGSSPVRIYQEAIWELTRDPCRDYTIDPGVDENGNSALPYVDYYTATSTGTWPNATWTGVNYLGIFQDSPTNGWTYSGCSADNKILIGYFYANEIPVTKSSATPSNPEFDPCRPEVAWYAYAEIVVDQNTTPNGYSPSAMIIGWTLNGNEGGPGYAIRSNYGRGSAYSSNSYYWYIYRSGMPHEINGGIYSNPTYVPNTKVYSEYLAEKAPKNSLGDPDYGYRREIVVAWYNSPTTQDYSPVSKKVLITNRGKVSQTWKVFLNYNAWTGAYSGTIDFTLAPGQTYTRNDMPESPNSTASPTSPTAYDKYSLEGVF